MNFKRATLLVCAVFSFTIGFAQRILEDTKNTLHSPDGNFKFEVYQKELEKGKKQLYYTVDFNGQSIILESELGVLIENQLFESALAVPNDTTTVWGENLDLIATTKDVQDETWKPLYGERNEIRNHYNELTLHFQKYGNPEEGLVKGHSGKFYDKRQQYNMDLVIRAYDEGIAFSYHFPETSNGLFLHITGEQTSFTLPEGTMAYYEGWAQGPYELKPLKNWPEESERPLTLTLENGLTLALTEARLVNFARTKFRLSEDKPNTLETSLYNEVDVISPYSTPWRVIMAAEQPGQLLENNDLILNLNPKNQIANTSWIKPGKVFRSDLTTEAAKEAVDFASERNIQYVHLDAGWYGPEVKFSTDASTIDPDRDLDLQEVINYGATKDIGIFVYVNQRPLSWQLDELLPLYQSWGLRGLKFGFVQIGSDKWTSWMHEAITKAAYHHLMVNVHDEYRPTGFSRTYPNLMTQEGIRGNEEMPDADHNTILPFTRYLAGAGDYTICYYNNRIKTTHAHQLALSVVYYSPLQYMFWYDKPNFYQGEPEIEFFDKVKTVWDDTKVINGEIGKYITVARRDNKDWFIGSITNTDARDLSVPLDFLEDGQNYIAHLYLDDETVDTRTQVAIHKYAVKKGDNLKLVLKASGGAALHLEAVESISGYKKLPSSGL
ncbi:glycoside hydrolase family 97 catalytic domain-containing protein [Echinicola jeungdonensis]|uniref:Glycoside hydrolase family 97 catalytic domain-containing protein n=1 Tax=Echinicola jeungdonensis TaxID=709343 RepID=A0ABV5JAC7_9BACT|nr:glycoside hydrolase family 97 protein [Echinicola jeungdonensis]MDN3670471.1 glycoside hydrolase family 97 catalytic domain-containing protein [Echinicola jeungdonensis]